MSEWEKSDHWLLISGSDRPFHFVSSYCENGKKVKERGMKVKGNNGGERRTVWFTLKKRR
jgi:hypothetical protein